VPPEKLVLGLPAYARHARHPGQAKSYAEVVDAAESASGAHSPLVAAPAERTPDGFAGNGPSLVADKVAWAASEGLAGVFFWEMGQDKLGHPQSLIAAAAAASGVKATLPKALPQRPYERIEL
jgi:GH18 family chitinase